jgi:hypothetical protein
MTTRYWAVPMSVALAFTFAACGGGDDDADLADVAADGGQTELSGADIVDTIADVVGDVLAETEDAPGAVRFLNLVQRDGAGIDVDVWWGRPEDNQKVTSLAYGEASEYFTPRQSTTFDEVSWSMSAAGEQEELIGFSYTPGEDIQRTLVVYPDKDGALWMTALDEILKFAPDEGYWGFEPPDGGQVRVKWTPIPDVLEAPSGNLRNIGTGSGDCLTNGTGINATDDASTGSGTFQVPGGTVLNLYEDFPTCSGATSATVTALAGGRAFLFAYADPSGTPQLLMLPVQD